MSYICFEPYRNVEQALHCFTSQTTTCSNGEEMSVYSELHALVQMTAGDCADACSVHHCDNGGSCVINDDEEAECICSMDIYYGDHCQLSK